MRLTQMSEKFWFAISLLVSWAIHLSLGANSTIVHYCDSSVSTASQQESLLQIFVLTNGLSWSSKSNWPSISAPSGVATYIASHPAVASGTCFWPPQNMDVNPMGALTEPSTASTAASSELAGWSPWQALGCELQTLDLHFNSLTGSLPSDFSTFWKLGFLNLNHNNLQGRIPEYLGSFTALQTLLLSSNRFSGTVPGTLCDLGPGSPLVTLDLSRNVLSGSLNISTCGGLYAVDASLNQFTGNFPALQEYNNLQVLQLSSNNFQNVTIGGCMITVDLSNNTNFIALFGIDSPLSMYYLGTAPGLAATFSTQSLNFQATNFKGTVPSFWLQLDSLIALDLSDNMVTGPIPDTIRDTVSLLSLNLFNNTLTGLIPSGITTILARSGASMDLSMNFLSCCSSGFNPETQSYAHFNASFPLLPDGLAFSSSFKRPVALPGLLGHNEHTSKYQGLSCPYLRLSSTTDSPSNLLINFYVDPDYYMYEGCVCDMGFKASIPQPTPGKPPTLSCIPDNAGPGGLVWYSQYPWELVIVAVVATATIYSFIWFFFLRRGNRPQLVQHMIDMRKRLRPAPVNGAMSIVVTDIEGFSDLMKNSPELMMKALLAHNNLIQSAKSNNFGHIVEQEGDSYSIAFEEAADAVKFCIHVQHMLANYGWPKGLFKEFKDETEKPEDSGPGVISRFSERMKQIINPQRTATTLPTPSTESTHQPIPHRSYSRTTDSSSAGKGLRTQTLSEPLPPQQQDLAITVATSLPLCLTPPELTLTESRNVESTAGIHPSDELRAGSVTGNAPSVAGGFRERLGSVLPTLFSKEEVEPAVWETSMLLGITPHSSLERSLTGLRVRMGIATGIIRSLGQGPGGSALLEHATLVSDAGAGGQILMCSSAFKAVKDRTSELGCVNEKGLDLDLLYGTAGWWRYIWGSFDHLKGREAVLLDMGEYLYCQPDVETPLVLTARDLNLKAIDVPASATAGTATPAPAGTGAASAGNKVSPEGVVMTLHSGGASDDGPTALPSSSMGPASQRNLDRSTSFQRSALVRRSGLAWISLISTHLACLPCLDYHQKTYCAPSLAMSPLSFAWLTGGKQFALKHRKDASDMGRDTAAIMRSVVRQVPGGYFLRQQDGDLKYVLVFSTPEDALLFCISAQFSSMYADWSLPVLMHWPTERGQEGQLLFRGPRLKMGVCEGEPTSIMPDHMGRADYHGPSVNQAARFMDAAAHGGQITCSQALANRVLQSWASSAAVAFSNSPQQQQDTTHGHTPLDPLDSQSKLQSGAAPSSKGAAAPSSKGAVASISLGAVVPSSVSAAAPSSMSAASGTTRSFGTQHSSHRTRVNSDQYEYEADPAHGLQERCHLINLEVHQQDAQQLGLPLQRPAGDVCESIQDVHDRGIKLVPQTGIAVLEQTDVEQTISLTSAVTRPSATLDTGKEVPGTQQLWTHIAPYSELMNELSSSPHQEAVGGEAQLGSTTPTTASMSTHALDKERQLNLPAGAVEKMTHNVMKASVTAYLRAPEETSGQPSQDMRSGAPIAWNAAEETNSSSEGHKQGVTSTVLGAPLRSDEIIARPAGPVAGPEGRDAPGPPLWGLPVDLVVDGRWLDVCVLKLGQFRFKGSLEIVTMVSFTTASLLERRYPAEPPQAKA
ncbi:hypothetical protein CEUSTIGMA_g6178.t1 [Chlamydomonas eustigma]|uniref:Uncharacterized protein n=1 Tax=Chlamydomonas eustigma TaxID=1157962 RepID=A0A250X6N4_9CHLO|nr:hypothetical protein CEUSTIGMA_g6178.t1 [Chlamydomonas eustigma]|eukprot:GAX78741.1 hypothetical protein CEUSTIGMA_g6178.t1 [Chlamydomonas eustigma]